MPRSPRAHEAGVLYNALNRANLGAEVFRKEGDFVAFEKVLSEALQLYQVELFAYQIMGTRWRLILRPLVDGEMGRWRNGAILQMGRWHTYDAIQRSLPCNRERSPLLRTLQEFSNSG